MRERLDLLVGRAPHDVVCRNVARVQQPGRLHQLLEGVQRHAVKVEHALRFVGHHQRLLAQRVLRGDAGGAMPGVAGLCLQATQGEHKTACAVAPVGTQRHHAGDVKRAHHLAGAADFDAVAQAHAAQGVVHQQQAFLQG